MELVIFGFAALVAGVYVGMWLTRRHDIEDDDVEFTTSYSEPYTLDTRGPEDR